MPAAWTFMLADANGSNLAEMSTASGRTVAFKRNSYTEVNLTVSHEDDSAGLLLTALANAGVPKLRAYRRGVNNPTTQPAPLRFRGYLAALSETSDENSTLTATFRSPFAVLAGDGDKSARYIQAPLTFTATDAGAIAKSLVDMANTDSFTGLATDPSLIAETVPRDCVYPVAQNIGAAITDLTQLLDGFDFYETFVDGVGPTDAKFNVTASLGNVNPNARFEYGETTLSNVASMGRTTTPPQNCILVVGGNGMTSVYSDTTSVAEYGKWWGYYDLSSVVDQPTLDARARELCQPKPIKVLTFVPDLSLSPLPFDDWNLGDTVPFYASRGGLQEDTQLRINAFTIPISDDGEETIETSDPTSPEEDAVLRASFTASEVLD